LRLAIAEVWLVGKAAVETGVMMIKLDFLVAMPVVIF
jgi:hypothetical protein